MTAREYLEQLRTIDREMEAVIEKGRTIFEKATSTGESFSGVRVQTAVNSKVENAVIMLDEYGDELQQKVNDALSMKKEAKLLIDSIKDERHRCILTFRYLYNWAWYKVIEYAHYESSHVYRLHGEALVEFEKVYKTMGDNGS